MNGRAVGSISASDIDRYIHFSCRKNLSQLHDDLMLLIEERIHANNKNILVEFAQFGKPGHAECSYDNFKTILDRLGLNF
jgi:hypothetical protein